MSQTLLKAIQDRSARVAVLGLGYVGLPLVRTFCRAGFDCVGYDIDQSKIDKLKRGESYIKHLPSGLIKDLVGSGRFHPTSDAEALVRCDALLICVPTPLTPAREPDMTYVEGTAQLVASRLRAGQLIVLESTTYPGTTRELVRPILEGVGLRADKDFYLAYSPEREDPGRKDFSTETIPKLVGGLSPESTKLATALYGAAIKTVIPVANCEIAEAAKIVENVYRGVNIAMVNELKMLFDRMGINVWEVIAAASTKPFGFHPFYPGPGLGGHCIPIDPFYLTWKARHYGMTTRFIELAGEINHAMPGYVVARVAEALNSVKRAVNGSRILVVGLAYKKDVDDLRESPSIILIEEMQKRGAKVDYHDPYIPRTHAQREHDLKMESVPLTAENVASYDCILIATDHSEIDYQWLVDKSCLIVDTRNATAKCKNTSGKVFAA